jgi:hypothetical protein
MKQGNPLHFIRWLAIVLPLAAVLCTSPSTAAPIPLPDWAKPIASSLPKLTPELIAEVDDLCYIIDDELFMQPALKEKKRNSLMRLVALGEQADQAMLWQYFKLTEDMSPRLELLMSSHLCRDRNLAEWLLPVIRFRMELFLQAIRENRLAEFLAAQNEIWKSELGATQYYFMRQGERSDMENLYRVYDEHLKIDPKSDFMYMSLEDCLKEMEEGRKRWGQDDGPYWKTEAERWIEKGVLTEEDFNTALRAANSNRATSHPGPLGPSLPLAGDPAPSAGAASPGRSPWHWLLWGGLSLVALSLLWRLHKRRS